MKKRNKIVKVLTQGIIHLVRTQYFPKSKYQLHRDTHTHVCVSGVRNVSFLEDFTYVLSK